MRPPPLTYPMLQVPKSQTQYNSISIIIQPYEHDHFLTVQIVVFIAKFYCSCEDIEIGTRYGYFFNYSSNHNTISVF